nr:PRC-barrel domain-containing protein [uncultured Halomonas sp.]
MINKDETAREAQQGRGANDKTNPDQRSGAKLMGANDLVGSNVYNHQYEKIGDIKELMIDTSNGRVEYAVLSFGGFLGLGKKLFAVPWKALQLDAENKRFMLDAEKRDLKDAPGFEKDDWPNMAGQKWSS